MNLKEDDLVSAVALVVDTDEGTADGVVLAGEDADSGAPAEDAAATEESPDAT
jgi:hypothetical protein